MEAKSGELRTALRSVNGRLSDLVAEEQARREAAVAAASRASAASSQPNSTSPNGSGRPAAGVTTTTGAERPTTGVTSTTRPNGGPVTTAPPTTRPPTTTPPPPPPPPPPSPSGGTAAGRAAVSAALTQLGVPYKWGASSPGSGFDCSGLVNWAYAQAGVSVPRTSRTLRSATRHISEAELVPGDLVFGGSPIHHVGIYIGNGEMVHAPRSGDVVKISGIYRSATPVSFGRL
jgi:cell wall-associated NlpC family hydrolase